MGINRNDVIYMRGITDERQKSLGSVIFSIFVKKIAIEHKFYVVSDDFPMPSHGIIGKDFLRRHKCTLDYDQMALSIRPSNEILIKIPIQSNISENQTAVPPNSEVYKLFRLNFESFPCIVEAQNITNHIMVPTTIALSKESWIRVLNTTDEMQIIDVTKLKCSNINQFHIYQCTGQNQMTRDDKLIEIVKGTTPTYAHDQLIPLCREYSDIFHLEGEKPTVNNFYSQSVNLTDKTPVFTRNYRLPQSQKTIISGEVNRLLADQLIEPCASNFNSPLLIVPKKSIDGAPKFRMCVDYRKLNRKLIPDRFPMPRIEDIFDNLGSAKYFSVMDLQAGYHQIPINKNSRKYLAFSSDTGMYQWKVLPFGLSIAPSAFSRMMALAFSGLSPERCFSYMDDLIVIGYSEKNHIENLKKVFDTCRKCCLKLNPLKCQFFKTEVSFLGHICSNKGLKPDPKKLIAVEKYPTPTDKESVKRFVAFMNYYRRFIENFAKITQPLTYLTKKRVEFEWTRECENSFQLLKECLLSKPILKYPNFEKHFKVIVDASDFACGAVLTQEYDGVDMPITYISRTFKKGERNKPAIEKELLAVHFAVTQLRPYIYGRHFTVKSDHKPLAYLYNLKNPSSKLSRLRLELEEYKFDIEYIKGKDNVIADALSRISIDELKSLYDKDIPVYAITRSMTRKAEQQTNDQKTQNTDIDCSDIKVFEDFNTGFTNKIPRLRTNAVSIKKNGIVTNMTITAYQSHKKLFVLKLANEKVSIPQLFSKLLEAASKTNVKKLQISTDDSVFKLCTISEFKKCGNDMLKKAKNMSISIIKPPRMIESQDEKMEILEKFHNDPIFGGHTGQKRLYAKLRQNYYWKHMTKDISNFVRNCENCKLNKHKMYTKEKMIVTETPSKPFESLIIDLIGPLTASNGKLYVVTIICDLTKYLVCIPISGKSAKEVAKAIFEKFILVYGPMKSIRTDRGTEFTAKLISELCELMGIKHSLSTAYHHQSLGTIERNHAEFNKYIRQYIHENMGDWENYIEYFTFCYNIEKHGSNNYNYSPYELVFARTVNLPTEIKSDTIQPLYNPDDFVKEAKFRLQNAHKAAKEFINKFKIKNKQYYDKTSNPIQLRVGDEIYLQNEPYDKLNTLRKKYRVTDVKHPNVTISDGQNTLIVHKNRLLK